MPVLVPRSRGRLASVATVALLLGLPAGALRPARLSAQRPVPRDTAAQRARADSLTGPLSTEAVLQVVRVTVTRDAPRSPFELPYAISSAPLNARPAVRRVGLGDLTVLLPGVQVFDRANPSQDPRLTIRGFGSRSAFGTRGVRVIRDGVPVSLPDGQTPLDWVDLETVGSLDVVRGTAAALYGNAAGGVVELRSREIPARAATVDSRVWDGGGLRRWHATVTSSSADSVGRLRGPQALVAVTRTDGPGARRWSRLEATSAFGRVLATVGGTRLELQATRYDAPRAENTGALTAAELARDPRLPDSLNVTKRSRKAVSQSQVALLAERDVAGGTMRGHLFAGTRGLDNPLPFAMVAVDRATFGGGVHGAWRWTRRTRSIRLGIGADVQQQTDDRLNFENCADLAVTAPRTVRCPVVAERGAVRLDQREGVTGGGAYGRVEVDAAPRLAISAALRADQVRFSVRDRFVTPANADDSGDRRLGALTPMVGLVWRPRPTWSWYANLSSAFETPTITELTNQDDGRAGLNRSLAPQRTRTVEVGTQALAGAHLRIEAAAFRAAVRDELVPFDVPNQPGRRAFRNAGRTARTGAEVAVRGAWAPVEAGVAYTWSHFRFVEYQVGTTAFAGRAIPGVPAHTLQSFATARRGILFATIEGLATARMAADDANSVWAAGAAVWHARVGAEGWRVRGVRVEPAVGVENLFDRRFAGAVVINATRGRFFEPGLPRRASVMVRLGR